MEKQVERLKLVSPLQKKRREFRYFEGVNQGTSKKIDETTRVFFDKLCYIQSYGLQNESMYQNAIRFLDNDINLTYDEKVIFLIRLLDPTLKMLMIYQDAVNSKPRYKDMIPILTKGHLFALDTEEEKLKEEIINNLGFYDPLLLKYEGLYKRILQTHETLDKTTDLKLNYTKYVSSIIHLDSLSLRISPDELDAVVEEAEEYLKIYPKPALNDLLFQLLHETGTMDYEKFKTKLIFIICVLDRDLKYKDIYDTNYNLVTIRNKIASIFGCYHQFLMDLEQKFVKDNFEEQYSTPSNVGGARKMPTYR